MQVVPPSFPEHPTLIPRPPHCHSLIAVHSPSSLLYEGEEDILGVAKGGAVCGDEGPHCTHYIHYHCSVGGQQVKCGKVNLVHYGVVAQQPYKADQKDREKKVRIKIAEDTHDHAALMGVCMYSNCYLVSLVHPLQLYPYSLPIPSV